MIERLTVLAPDPGRTARTRTRCHNKLELLSRSVVPRRFQVERAGLLGFGAIYLSSLTLTVLQVLMRS